MFRNRNRIRRQDQAACLLILTCLATIFLGCRPLESDPTPDTVDSPRAASNKPDSAADFSFVCFGNSHSSVATPFDQLRRLITSRKDQPTASLKIVTVGFLDMLQPRKHEFAQPDYRVPQFVVMQGQKISTSGKYEFPIEPAVDIAKIFAEKGAQVLLFSEWGRLGVEGETERTQQIYEQIAAEANANQLEQTGVFVVPVGRVWQEVLKQFPNHTLHSRDGNHSNNLGGSVTAITFYSWLFDEPPTVRPDNMDDQQYFENVCRIALQVCRQQKDNSPLTTIDSNSNTRGASHSPKNAQPDGSE